MSNRFNLYKCSGNDAIVEVLSEAGVSPACCGEDMQSLTPKTQDKGQEKHVPVIEETGNGVKVKVGDVPHPMEEEHFIQWIEVIAGDREYRHFLHPGQKPEAEFPIPKAEITHVREYCNVHGLWKA